MDNLAPNVPSTTLTVGSLCTGYGGLDMALRAASLPTETVWVADNDAAAKTLLTHHHPDVPNLGDITTVDWATVAPVDMITAGYPCQPFSDAGLRKAEDDDRYIWPAVENAIRVVRPRWVLLENVRGHVGRGFATIVARLATLGYVGSWICVRASDVGAPHRRERLFVLAADATRERHGDPRQTVRQGLPAAAVAGAVRVVGADLLPTPNAALGRGTGFPSRETAQDRVDRHKRFLDDAVALLPTPRTSDVNGGGLHGNGGVDLRTAVTLLPTPRATDGTKGGPNQHGTSGDLVLPSAVMRLLPTPVVADSRGSRNATANRTDPLPTTTTSSWTLSDVAYATQWDQYAAAIAQWETVAGRPAPEPTEPNRKGNPRLSARFVEWLMGLPAGYVTDVPGLSRNDMLRLLGNGVVPQQGAAALTYLASQVSVDGV